MSNNELPVQFSQMRWHQYEYSIEERRNNPDSAGDYPKRPYRFDVVTQLNQVLWTPFRNVSLERVTMDCVLGERPQGVETMTVLRATRSRSASRRMPALLVTCSSISQASTHSKDWSLKGSR